MPQRLTICMPKWLGTTMKDWYKNFGPPPVLTGGRLPHNYNVVWSLGGFILFGVFVAISAEYHTWWTKFSVGVIGVVLFGCIMIAAVFDIFLQRPTQQRIYSRNLGNTVLTAIAATGIVTGLYVWQWYPDMNQIVIQLSDDTVTEASYPGIALFQRYEWSAQAQLRAGHSKCFMGWYNDTAPICTAINSSSITNSQSCNCKNIWSSSIVEDFEYQNRQFRYLEFPSAMKLNCTTPTTLLWLQAFFDYNSSQAFTDNGYTPSPGLSIAIYDSSLNLTYALNNSYTQLLDINASGATSINLGLRYRRLLNGFGVYDYDISMSTAPALNIVCDTKDNYTNYEGACATSLFIRIPSFDRSVRTEQKAMTWMNVVASAGAYYSFVQFVSWILSGAAFAA